MAALDPQAQEILNHYATFGVQPIETLTPHQARNVPLLDYAARDLTASKVAARLLTIATPTPEQGIAITHLSIPSPEGGLLLRIYTPVSDRAPFPVLVYFHGGGWVVANLDTYDASARALCKAAECMVISVAYRQAPEHKFPAAVEDAAFATEWVMENAEKLNGDPEQIAVGGESAGGNLAAVVCQALLAGGLGLPVHQLLIYPVTDLTFDKPSFREHAHAQPLSAAMMPWFAHHYLASESDIPNPRVSPLRAPDLSGLPPATIITAEHDPLRDDGRAYAKRLQDAGVKVNYRNYPGLMHEFFGLAGMIDAAREAVNEAARDLNESFGRARTPALL